MPDSADHRSPQPRPRVPGRRPAPNIVTIIEQRMVTQVVQELADRYWDRLLAADPLLALQCGDDPYSHRLPDLSQSRRVAREHLASGAPADVAVPMRYASGLN